MKAEENRVGALHRKNHKNRKEQGRLASAFTEIIVFTAKPAPTTPPGGRRQDCPGDVLNKADGVLTDKPHRPDEVLNKLEVAPACRDASYG